MMRKITLIVKFDEKYADGPIRTMCKCKFCALVESQAGDSEVPG